MGKRSFALRAFLGIYIVLLVYHLATEASEITPITAGALLLGIIIAVYAHTRSGLMLYSLLFFHMAVEWIGYAIRGWKFSWPDSVLEILHLMFDLCFLFILARLQWKQKYVVVFSATIFVLWMVSATVPLLLDAPHSFQIGALEFLIFGGIFGCTGFHLVRPFSNERFFLLRTYRDSIAANRKERGDFSYRYIDSSKTGAEIQLLLKSVRTTQNRATRCRFGEFSKTKTTHLVRLLKK